MVLVGGDNLSYNQSLIKKINSSNLCAAFTHVIPIGAFLSLFVAYHQKCIDPWLLKNKRTCPVCKRRVVPKSPRRRNDTENADSSDSDDAEEGNEQQPLLRPPVGRRRSSGGRRSNDDESSSYGATGYQRKYNLVFKYCLTF